MASWWELLYGSVTVLLTVLAVSQRGSSAALHSSHSIAHSKPAPLAHRTEGKRRHKPQGVELSTSFSQLSALRRHHQKNTDQTHNRSAQHAKPIDYTLYNDSWIFELELFVPFSLMFKKFSI